MQILTVHFSLGWCSWHSMGTWMLYLSHQLWNMDCWLCCHIGEENKAPNWAKLKPCRYILALSVWTTRQKRQQSILSAFMATHAHNASWKRCYRLLALKDFIIPAFFPAPAIIFPAWIYSGVTSGELLSTAALQIGPWNSSHLGLFSWSFKLGCWWIDTNYPLLHVAMLAPIDFVIVVRDACSCLFFLFFLILIYSRRMRWWIWGFLSSRQGSLSIFFNSGNMLE